MATQGSITTATLPFGYGLSALLAHNDFLHWLILLHRIADILSRHGSDAWF